MDWLAKTDHLGLDDEGEVYLLDLASEDPDHVHLGGINEGRAYRKCPREFTEEWWTIEDAWQEEVENLVDQADTEAERERTYRTQQLGPT